MRELYVYKDNHYWPIYFKVEDKLCYKFTYGETKFSSDKDIKNFIPLTIGVCIRRLNEDDFLCKHNMPLLKEFLEGI